VFISFLKRRRKDERRMSLVINEWIIISSMDCFKTKKSCYLALRHCKQDSIQLLFSESSRFQHRRGLEFNIEEGLKIILFSQSTLEHLPRLVPKVKPRRSFGLLDSVPNSKEIWSVPNAASSPNDGLFYRSPLQC